MEKCFAISTRFVQGLHDLKAVQSIVLYLTTKEIDVLREKMPIDSGILAFKLKADDLSFRGMKDMLKTAETLNCFDQALSTLRLNAPKSHQLKLKELTESGSLVEWIHSESQPI